MHAHRIVSVYLLECGDSSPLSFFSPKGVHPKAFWSAAIHRRFLYPEGAAPQIALGNGDSSLLLFYVPRRSRLPKESGDESPHSKSPPEV
jgi:hypothetical protein